MKTLLNNFEKEVQKWNNKFSQPGIEFIFNNDLKTVDIKNIKLILVGDNPGESEKKNGKYFCEDENNISSAGNNLARFINAIGYSRDKIIILNKTPIYTNKTKALEKIGSKILKETQDYMAELLYSIHAQIPEVPAIINGLAGCFDPSDSVWLKRTKNKTFYSNEILPYFFVKISDLYKKSLDLSKNLIILKHLAYWKIFDDFSFGVDSPKQSNRSRIVNKLSIKHFENKEVSFEEFIQVSKELNYVNTLPNI